MKLKLWTLKSGREKTESPEEGQPSERPAQSEKAQEKNPSHDGDKESSSHKNIRYKLQNGKELTATQKKILALENRVLNNMKMKSCKRKTKGFNG